LNLGKNQNEYVYPYEYEPYLYDDQEKHHDKKMNEIMKSGKIVKIKEKLKIKKR
jgi:hypothetical protein